MPTSARLLTALLLALVALVPASAAQARARSAAVCSGAAVQPGAASVETARSATLCLLNRQRARHHLRRLRANPRLQHAADAHSADMARHDYFNHDSQSGSSFVDRIVGAGYGLAGRSYTVAENIAWGQMSYATPRSIVTMWMHSPGHRANILNGRLREVGIGIAIGDPSGAASRGATYTTDFGTRS